MSKPRHESTVTGLRIDHVVTSGNFELDGGCWHVDNNIWIVGNDTDVIIIDAAHNSGPIIDAVAGRHVTAVICTHGHNDHITVAPEIAETLHAPVLLHPDDHMLWEATHPGSRFWNLHHKQEIALGSSTIRVLHTPGHSPGSVSLYVPDLGAVFTGDTLFAGGPGATGRSYSDFPTIIESITNQLFTLPESTHVHTGHGDSTTIGDEAPSLPTWIARGH